MVGGGAVAEESPEVTMESDTIVTARLAVKEVGRRCRQVRAQQASASWSRGWEL